jgi:predicted helicase
MPRIEPELQRLQEIKSLPSLIKYLKTDLNWPIESDDVDDVTFEYDAAELGFNTASTAQIEEVRQLRPLTSGQKWGIFWVKFGKKQLPVQMLRRALGNLVVKKRASTKKSDKAAWHMHDLLFISAYGDDSNRHITFAHFSESEDSEKSLPVLKVLGWDDDDTVLHLKDTYKTLLSTLNWDTTPVDDPEAWRNHWSSAFKIGHREVINTTKELVVELAQLATVIKKSVLTSIKAETERGPWRKLMVAFQKTLIKDLDDDQFADVIAQTISYGLLTARLSSDGPISLKNLVDMVPATNPFLKELLQHFLNSAGMKGLFDVDEAGINDVVELLNRANAQAIRNDFGKKTAGEDPVIHFYEHFLGAYNKKLKVDRGVFYTPQPVVSYIVRSVHELLQTEFGLEDGLADTSTWADVLKMHKDLKIPEGIKDPKIEPFVQILDPATGTATFLIEVIEVIHNTMTAKWDKERVSKADQLKKWNIYVPIHLLPRLYAYELMMAPYAIAHMKVGVKLAETGFTDWDKLGSENRANIFLTNALEPWTAQLNLPGFDALAHEASAVNNVKRCKRFTVIIGNPPYAGHSSNNGEWAMGLTERYYKIDGVGLNEANTKWLRDDYVKFFGLSQTALSLTGKGILGFVTNHGFIDNPTFRGMRYALLNDFSSCHILHLNGSAKKADDQQHDQNIFDIQQGVAIALLVNGPKASAAGTRFYDFLGSRELKYSRLKQTSVATTPWIDITPAAQFYFFIPEDAGLRSEFQAFVKLTEVMPQFSLGSLTKKDDLVVSFTKSESRNKILSFIDRSKTDTEATAEWGLMLRDKDMWDATTARKAVAPTSLDNFISTIDYRIWDTRYLFAHKDYVARLNRRIMSNMERPNIALVTVRQLASLPHQHFWVVNRPTDQCVISTRTKEGGVVFPLYLYSEQDELHFESINNQTHVVNFQSGFLASLAKSLGLVGSLLNAGIVHEDIFYYIYAVFNSPNYKRRYAEFLKIDFPRIPLVSNIKLFRELVKIGSELTALHLLVSPVLDKHITEFFGDKNSQVEKITWCKKTVWVDKAQTIGFKGVKEDVWNFHIGGFQVCEKWLKDRKGRKLTKDDIEHYQKIIVALSETIRLMAEIDKVIDEHGGWPGAFQISK